MRLIDADKLREDWLTNGENEHIYDTNAFLDSIDDQPTVDAEEVVRCKDCKQEEYCVRRIQIWGRNPVPDLYATEYHPLSFCSYGKKREEASNGS